MKITLKNFRCYENSTFDFGEQGLALLSGGSGSGKTSILLGIYFALFGTGTKLTMVGKSSCSVIVQFDGITIVRSKKPNRLIVNDVYEDAAGQSIIDEKFGSCFKTTGYVPQNFHSSFVLMSPLDKLEFLESFAFQHSNLVEIKKRCKDIITERHQTLIKAVSQLELTVSMFEELPKPLKVKFPLKCLKKNREKIVKNEYSNNKNSTITINKYKHTLITLEKELHLLELLESSVSSKQEMLFAIQTKMSSIVSENSSIAYDGDDTLTKNTDTLSSVIATRKQILLLKKYRDDSAIINTMKQEETESRNSNITSLETNRWQEYSKLHCNDSITHCKERIKSLEKCNELTQELERYSVNKEELRHSIEHLTTFKALLIEKEKLLRDLEIQQTIFTCPSCQTQLSLKDRSLCVVEHSVNTDSLTTETLTTETPSIVLNVITTLKKKITTLQSSILSAQGKVLRYAEISTSIQTIVEKYKDTSLSKSTQELHYLKKYKSTEEDKDKQLDTLKSQGYSSTIIALEKNLKKIQCLKLDETLTEDVDEEVLRATITQQTQYKEKTLFLSKELKKLTNEKVLYEKNIECSKVEHLRVYATINDTTKIKEEIQQITCALSLLVDTHSENTKTIASIETYQVYQKEKTLYNSWKEKINTLQAEETECRKSYSAATVLKEKIAEAESISMVTVISSINTHTQGYLDSFFPDNPISVKLVPFKESKTVKKKPQLNLQIEYKGMEADINMLSGGELSRVILAYALALGEMFNTPLMLLDECVANLDQELTGTVMESIKELFTGKLVITVCHQVVKGQFDRVITLGE